MDIKYYFPFFLCLLITGMVDAQSVKGTVVDENMEALIGANAVWVGTSTGTSSDESGSFELSAEGVSDWRIVVSYLGYRPDTFQVSDGANLFISLEPDNSLDEVVVEGRQTGTFISSKDIAKVETINSVELGKAACCDLAGCFNTNASVEPATTNIVTNAKELRILGLSGVYNQVLLDGFPLMRGLSYTYGVSSVPGPLVETIFVAKGMTSVLQGSESISGQINVILQKPVDAPPLFLNAFVNTFWEKQFNAYSGFQKGKFANMVGGHLVLPASKHDKNADTFLDLPQLTRYELLDNWKFGNGNEKGWFGRGGIRWTKEERTGGQVDFNKKTDLGSSQVYGQHISYNQVDAWKRLSFRANEKNNTALIMSGQRHTQDSWYGETNYIGTQHLFNATLQHEFTYKNGSNLRAGASFDFLDIDEDISFTNNPLNKTYAGHYDTRDAMPGIFAENTLFMKEDAVTWMLGGRLDYHPQFGWLAAPRSMFKYTPKANTDIRASVGFGRHRAKVFSEYARILASQRDIHFHGELDLETAWNYGLNITQKFEKTRVSGTFTADYYQTRFLNQITPLYMGGQGDIMFHNNRDGAVGNGFQVESSLDIWDWVNWKIAYNYLDIKQSRNGEMVSVEFVTKHRLLNTFSLAPKGQDWHFDLSAQWNGRKKLPDTSDSPEGLSRPDVSDPYAMFNAQFTYKWKTFEWYIGCENILGFMQDEPIISYQNPFSPYFDTSSAWGPTRGREGYLGIRYTLEKKKSE